MGAVNINVRRVFSSLPRWRQQNVACDFLDLSYFLSSPSRPASPNLHSLRMIRMNHQDQEVPAVVSEIGRLGCLLGASITSSPYQLHPDHYKCFNSTAVFPTDWREPWHQEGNSCETDDGEQYVPASEYTSSYPSNEAKTENMPVFHCSSKHLTYPNPHDIDSFESSYPHLHQHTGSTYSNSIYNRPNTVQSKNGESVLPTSPLYSSTHTSSVHLPIKQEPSDEGISRLFDKSKLDQSKLSQRNHNSLINPRNEKTIEEKRIDSKLSSFNISTGRRGSLQLWQFLVALLDTPDASAGCIAWTGRGMEFKLIEPEEESILFIPLLNRTFTS
ncbi:hypothetical protein WA026_007313 [Henosepilachna vigintioctopunctata]|uniref:ETS domain-containing protein n=1 Tax=Henosepilachna vigintioctopunctata TaxID=420089 RepID=A0AAW1UPJ1_9CUCU